MRQKYDMADSGRTPDNACSPYTEMCLRRDGTYPQRELSAMFDTQRCVYRELHELVMMRREELLAREAWAVEDAATRHAFLLRKHGERISRLFRPASPPLTDEDHRELDEVADVHPSASSATKRRESRRQLIRTSSQILSFSLTVAGKSDVPLVHPW